MESKEQQVAEIDSSAAPLDLSTQNTLFFYQFNRKVRINQETLETNPARNLLHL
jgi:hypothetical protein